MNNALSMIADTVSLSAPAKINIHLKVLDKRSDGFHSIESIFQRISISDYISVRKHQDSSVCIVESPLMELPKLNTVTRAWEVFRREVNTNSGIQVKLLKEVPAGSGLGAGSSDAASLLQAVNILFESGLTHQQLSKMALEVGSDVPFFFGSSAAMISGRGEYITPMKARSDYFGILICPDVCVSTKEAYSALDNSRMQNTGKQVQSITDIIGEYNKPAEQWSFFNDFQPVIEADHPEITAAYSDLYTQGAVFAQMSGSGSSVFGLFNNSITMKAALRCLSEKWLHCRPFLLLA